MESKGRQKRRNKSRPKVKFVGGKALLVTGIAGMKQRARIFISWLIMNRVMRKDNFVASTIKGLLLINLNLEVCMRSSQSPLGYLGTSQRCLDDGIKPKKHFVKWLDTRLSGHPSAGSSICNAQTTLRLHYSDQPLSANLGNNRPLLWDTHETHKSKNLCAKNEEYWALKQVIHTVTTVLESVSR